MTDYRRAFKIACELLNGTILCGVDADKIYEVMMDKDGMVTNTSYEEYILNHLQELDHGLYKESKNKIRTDVWCNTCEYRYLESECLGCGEYDENDNLIGFRHYKRESEEQE